MNNPFRILGFCCCFFCYADPQKNLFILCVFFSQPSILQPFTFCMFEFEALWTFIRLRASWVKMFENSEKKICLTNMERLSTLVKVGFSPKTIQHRASALSVTSYLSSRGLGHSECFNFNLDCQTLLHTLQRPSHCVCIRLDLEESWCMDHVLP